MSKILFLDLDGTVRRTKSGATFINDPCDQELIPGVKDAIARYQGWTIIGITNQGGVKAGFKTLENCIKEQTKTLLLLPQMRHIHFCPDDGETMYKVSSSGFAMKVTKDSFGGDVGNFRKPNTGMIFYALNAFKKIGEMNKDNFHEFEMIMIGDRPEDQECAKNANIPFMWAHEWRGDKL